VDLCLLSLCERLPPPGPTLLPYTTLFRSRVDQAQDEEAERLAREGLEMSMRQLRPNDPAIASATLALGQILEDRGRYAEAIEVLEEAVRLRRAAGGPPTPELASSLRELANTHYYAGHLAVADSIDRLVLAMTRRL